MWYRLAAAHLADEVVACQLLDLLTTPQHRYIDCCWQLLDVISPLGCWTQMCLMQECQRKLTIPWQDLPHVGRDLKDRGATWVDADRRCNWDIDDTLPWLYVSCCHKAPARVRLYCRLNLRKLQPVTHQHCSWFGTSRAAGLILTSSAQCEMRGTSLAGVFYLNASLDCPRHQAHEVRICSRLLGLYSLQSR